MAPSVELRRPFLHRVVPAGGGPEPLTAEQKFELSFRSAVSLGGVGTSLLSAGEGHLANSRPHYGSDKGAFGERLGAAELKQATESFFSYGLYAAAFHEDPHYYVKGPGHTFKDRAIYSATRVVLTQTDAGNTGVNWAKLAGVASAGALANAYYPPRDRTVGDTLSSFATSLAIATLSLELHEFMPDVKRKFLHRHGPSQ